MKSKNGENTDLPEYIEGIPTEKKRSKERGTIIKKEYIRLLEQLGNKQEIKAIFNRYLKANVYIIMRESAKKASNSASFNWQSTYAVKHLKTVIRDAIPLDEKTIYTTTKNTGKQKEFGYIKMATLYYTFHNEKHNHLNFIVKLVIGIKKDGRLVQYSVNKIEL